VDVPKVAVPIAVVSKAVKVALTVRKRTFEYYRRCSFVWHVDVLEVSILVALGIEAMNVAFAVHKRTSVDRFKRAFVRHVVFNLYGEDSRSKRRDKKRGEGGAQVPR
jgi:hypothetical protein